MKKDLEEIVQISGSAVCNIMRSIIEQKDFETIGDLLGKKFGKRYILINAYPWQNIENDTEGVTYGTFDGRKRVIAADLSMRENGESKFHVMGQYHSQVDFNGDISHGLSKGDLKFFELQKQWIKLPELIQIVASVKIKEYNKKWNKFESSREYSKKLRVIWRINPDGYGISRPTSFNVVFGAYKFINGQDEPSELPLKKRYVKVVSTKNRQ
jgi:hypothetical protein